MTHVNSKHPDFLHGVDKCEPHLMSLDFNKKRIRRGFVRCKLKAQSFFDCTTHSHAPNRGPELRKRTFGLEMSKHNDGSVFHKINRRVRHTTLVWFYGIESNAVSIVPIAMRNTSKCYFYLFTILNWMAKRIVSKQWRRYVYMYLNGTVCSVHTCPMMCISSTYIFVRAQMLYIS